jgi:hypothetical protein
MSQHAFETGEVLMEASRPDLYVVGADKKRHLIVDIGDEGSLAPPTIVNHRELLELPKGDSWSVGEALEILRCEVDDRDEVASRAYTIADLYAAREAAWYQKQRGKNGWRARATWTGVILFATLAGVVPVVAQMSNEIEPAWATLALVTSGFLFAMDRLYGYSASWQRFMEAKLRIDGLRFAFALEWLAARSSGMSSESLIQKAHKFVKMVADIELRETREWRRDFSSQLASLHHESQSMKTTTDSLKATEKAMASATKALNAATRAQPASSDGKVKEEGQTA